MNCSMASGENSGKLSVDVGREDREVSSGSWAWDEGANGDISRGCCVAVGIDGEVTG